MSASVSKSDINGSSLTVSYRDYNKDAAIRRFFVEAAHSDDKEVVIGAVFASISTHHNELTTLPLQSLTASRIGIGKWLVVGRYDRSVTAGLPLSGSILTDVATAFESMPIYTTLSTFTDGIPNGEILTGFDGLTNPSRSSVERKIWQRPVLRLKWPFDQSAHPMIGYRDAAGTTNKTALALGNSVGLLPAQSTRYDGFVCDSYATTNGVRYRGHHALTYSSSGNWKTQELTFNSEWEIKLVQAYAAGTWTLA
tara:strand:- start:3833 stop:4591 length:759 start_codon:yes stop_codon:yes gene_type:complete